MNSELCNICLEIHSTVVEITQSDETNVTWCTKLKFLAPELEWGEQYRICEFCRKLLDQAYQFKTVLLNACNLSLQKTEFYLEEESNGKDNFDTEYCYDVEQQKDVACEICARTFTTHMQFQQHKLQAHDKEMKIENFDTECLETNLPSHNQDSLDGSPHITTHTQFQQHKLLQAHNKEMKIENFDTECLETNLPSHKQDSLDGSPHITTHMQFQQHKLQAHNKEMKIENFDTECLETILPSHKQDSLDGSEDVFTCFDCASGFLSKDELVCHIRSDHGEAKLCLMCDELCSNKFILESHMKNIHGIDKSRKFRCSNCSKKFSEEKIYYGHIKLCKPQYQCVKCKEFLVTKKLLSQHLRNCKNKQSTANATYKCDLCNNFYVTEKNLNLHKLWCNKERQPILDSIDHRFSTDKTTNYYCDICAINFSTIKEYNSHKNTQHTEENIIAARNKPRGAKPVEKFSCEICNKKFVYVKLLVEHCLTIHLMVEKTVKAYACDQCNARFGSSKNLEQHRSYHEKTRSHICSLCGKGFITKSDLTVHEYTHYNRRNYKCSKCDKAFNTNKNLRTHDLVVHADHSLWKYNCAICKKRFPLKTNYEQHLRRHTGEKQFPCHICKKTFITKSELKRHVFLHSNIRAHKCEHCGREYKERRTYNTHLAKVHAIGDAKIPIREKKFVCHICPSQFYDKQKLSRHIYSHSGLKPFACNACDKRFSDKSYLKHHLKIVHHIFESNNSMD